MTPEVDALQKRARARKMRFVYLGTLVLGLVLGGAFAAWRQASNPCRAVAARVCTGGAPLCEELEEGMIRLDPAACRRALQALDAADRLPANLRPAMLAQVIADLTGQTGRVEEEKEKLKASHPGADASASR